MIVKEKKAICDFFFKAFFQEIEAMREDWSEEGNSPFAFHIKDAYYPDKDYFSCARFHVQELEGWVGSCEITSIKKIAGKKEYSIIANYYFQYEELADKVRYSHSWYEFKGYFKFHLLRDDNTQCCYYSFEEYPDLPYQSLSGLHLAMNKIQRHKWMAIYRDWAMEDLENISARKARRKIKKSLRYSRRNDYYSQKYSYAFAKRVAKLTARWEDIPESDVFIHDEGESSSPRYEIIIFVDENKNNIYEREGCYGVSDKEAKIISKIENVYHWLMKIRGLYSWNVDSFYHYSVYYKKNKTKVLEKFKKWDIEEQESFGKKDINFRGKTVDNIKKLCYNEFVNQSEV